MRKSIPSIHSQLLANQLWETVAFVAKAAFLFVLTPIMIGKWGVNGYGEFAIASSTMIFFSMFDLGLRGRARVQLCQNFSSGDQEKAWDIMARAISRFAVIAVVILGVVGGLAFTGLWSRMLNLPPGHDHLIVITALCTEIYMLVGFFLEPLVAEGRIGTLKLASACGAAVAIPAVWLVLHYDGSVALVITTWLGCLTTTNFLTLLLTGHWRQIARWKWMGALRGRWRETLFDGMWFNITNVTWLLKNHGLIFLISAISGPATTGTFFIILRLSEIIGSFGAISCDVGLGAMSTGDLEHRRKVFSSVFSYATILCLLLALGIGGLAPTFWQFWLKTPAPLGWATGGYAAFLGLASGLNRIIVYAALALGLVRTAAIWSMAEAVVVLIGTCVTQHWFGLGATLLLTTLAVTLLIPLAWKISQVLEQPFRETWHPRILATIRDRVVSLRSWLDGF